MSRVEGWNSRRGAEPWRRPRGFPFTLCVVCGFNCGAVPETVIDGRPYHVRCAPSDSNQEVGE